MLREIATRFGRLGLTAFGGPVAHLGYFRTEFVERARWLDDASFAELVALCGVLPGPTSSEVGIALGWRRGGVRGALVAWFAFTAPSAIALAVVGIALRGAVVAHAPPPAVVGALAGLVATAAAVVLRAVARLGMTLAATPRRAAIAVTAAVLVVAAPLAHLNAVAAPLALALGFAIGALALTSETPALPEETEPARSLLGGGDARTSHDAPPHAPSRGLAIGAGVALVVLVLASLGARATGGALGLAGVFFRTGALVVGGGHVVLPFLETAIPASLVPREIVVAGYGAAQSVPGPLFTFASFLGAANRSPVSGIAGAALATVAIFAPAFLLVAAALPLWSRLRRLPRAAAALAGGNAAVVGVLGAVLVDPIAPALGRSPLAFALAPLALVAVLRAVPPWAIVVGAAALGAGVGSTLPGWAR